MRNKFKMASSRERHYLFPIPVIEDKKFLIETHSFKEAQLIQALLAAGWICINEDTPSEFWRDVGLHIDEKTRRFAPDWSNLILSYFPRDFSQDASNNERDEFKKSRLEKVVSRALSELILYRSQPSNEIKAEVDFQLLTRLRSKIQAQINCRTCKSLGIEEVSFGFLLNSL